jgi:hypothetical protein
VEVAALVGSWPSGKLSPQLVVTKIITSVNRLAVNKLRVRFIIVLIRNYIVIGIKFCIRQGIVS